MLFKSKNFFLLFLVIFILLAEFGILYYFLVLIPRRPVVIKLPTRYLVEVSSDNLPRFTFSSGEIKELKKAFEREREFLLEKIDSGEKFFLGERKVSPTLIKESAELFLKTLEEAKSEDELKNLIKKRFTVYQALGEKGDGKVFFTGYYTPVYEGSLKKHGPFRYPVYVKPEDLKIADLGRFNPALEGVKIVYRIDYKRGEIVPYWTREEIVKGKILEGKGVELLYLKSRIDRFFLMIEGSGKIILDDGRCIWVRYSADNGRPYRSIGMLLVKDKKISLANLSPFSIREYFERHPDQIDLYFNKNPRFVFFTKDEDTKGAIGATGGELTPERSIAVDKKIFPLGAPAYIVYKDEKLKDKVVSRFVFCQDTGGAIKGAGRVDIYFGEGDRALKKSLIKCEGRFYILIKK